MQQTFGRRICYAACARIDGDGIRQIVFQEIAPAGIHAFKRETTVARVSVKFHRRGLLAKGEDVHHSVAVDISDGGHVRRTDQEVDGVGAGAVGGQEIGAREGPGKLEKTIDAASAVHSNPIDDGAKEVGEAVARIIRKDYPIGNRGEVCRPIGPKFPPAIDALEGQPAASFSVKNYEVGGAIAIDVQSGKLRVV